MIRRPRFPLSLGVALVIAFSGFSAEAKSDEAQPDADSRTVTEDLLRTLNQEGRLSDEGYRELLERNEAEREARKRDRDKEWRFKWKNGLRFQRKDGRHKLKIAGHIQNDWALIDYGRETARSEGLDDEDLVTGTEFRRARVAFSGLLYKRLGFKAQVDFSNGNADLKGAWISIRKLGPLGTLKIGQMRQPLSLEGMTGSKYTTFMERALPNTLVPDRGTGIQFSNAPLKGRMTWTLAALRRTDDSGRDFSGDVAYDVGLRVTALPIYQNKGEVLVHVGGSYIHQFRSGGESVRYRARPEASLSRRLINTGNIDTRGQDLFGVELAVVTGPVSFQTEMIGALVNQRGGSEVFFWGAYGMATLSLGDEHRQFDRKSATLDRMEVNHPFNPEKGHWGAWELAARISYLDLNDRDIQGGQLRDFTAGINWHLFSNFRWMVNYVLADNQGDDVTHLGQMRFQLDF